MEAKDGARSSADDLKSGDEKEPEEAAANAGHQLVMALVQHASRLLHSDMAGFFEEHVESFMDFEESDARERGAGDSHEQYGIFRLYTAELEHHLTARAPAISIPCASASARSRSCPRRPRARAARAPRSASRLVLARTAEPQLQPRATRGSTPPAPASPLIAQTAVATDLERHGADGHTRAAVRARAPPPATSTGAATRPTRRTRPTTPRRRARPATTTTTAARQGRARREARRGREGRAGVRAAAARGVRAFAQPMPLEALLQSVLGRRVSAVRAARHARARSPRAARGSRSRPRARARDGRGSTRSPSRRAATAGGRRGRRSPREPASPPRRRRRAARRAATATCAWAIEELKERLCQIRRTARMHSATVAPTPRWSSIVSLDPSAARPSTSSGRHARPFCSS